MSIIMKCLVIKIEIIWKHIHIFILKYKEGIVNWRMY